MTLSFVDWVHFLKNILMCGIKGSSLVPNLCMVRIILQITVTYLPQIRSSVSVCR